MGDRTTALVAIGLMLAGPAALAQQATPQPGLALAATGWTARCSGTARQGPFDCVMEQRLVVQGSGQPFVTLAVHVPAAPATRVLTVQTPLGIRTGPGVSLTVDGAGPTTISVDGCDANGCYASTPASDALLGALRGGQTLTVALQTLAGEPLSVDVPLSGFTRTLTSIE